jgi:hypothetical protein
VGGRCCQPADLARPHFEVQIPHPAIACRTQREPDISRRRWETYSAGAESPDQGAGRDAPLTEALEELGGVRLEPGSARPLPRNTFSATVRSGNRELLVHDRDPRPLRLPGRTERLLLSVHLDRAAVRTVDSGEHLP